MLNLYVMRNDMNTLNKLSFAAVFALIFALTLSCSRSRHNIEFSQEPHIFYTEGMTLPDSAVSPPMITPAGEPQITVVKRKKEITYESNVTAAGAAELLGDLKADVKTPGTGGLSLPKVKKASSYSIFSKSPDKTDAKDPFIRENNPFSFSSYGLLQGLRSNQLRSMIEDSLGNLWLGSDDGLVRFDGKYFWHFKQKQGLKSDIILSLMEDSRRNIWIGSFRGGVVKYDGVSFSFMDDSTGVSNITVNSFYEDRDGRIWIGSGMGLICYSRDTLRFYSTREGLCDDDIRCVSQDSEGNIWAGGASGGFSVFNGKSFRNYSIKKYSNFDFVSDIISDKKGTIWLASRAGVIKYEKGSFYLYSTENGLKSNFVRGVMQDSRGEFWFTYDDSGVCRFDGKDFHHYGYNEGLSSDFVKSSVEDMHGNIWFATRLSGLSRYDGDKFLHLTKYQGLSNDRVMSVLEVDQDELWFATFGGYITIYKKIEKNRALSYSVSYFGKDEGLPGSRIYSLIKDRKGRIWIGSDGGGISVYDGIRTLTYTSKQGLASTVIRNLYEDSRGNIWISTYGGGAVKFDGVSFETYNTSSGMSSNNIQTICEDRKGNIWFGTDGGGITLYDGKHFKHLNSKSGFVDDIIYSIKEDENGYIWIGTSSNGIVCFNGESFTRFNDSNGLTNNKVFSIITAGEGKVAAGTRDGLNILSTSIKKQGDKSEVDAVINSFGYEDGFSGSSCNLDAMTLQSDGTLWIGTSNKLTAFIKFKEPPVDPPSNIQITNFLLFNQSIPWNSIKSNKDTSIILANGIEPGRITFDSVSKWYNLPEGLKLSYKNNFVDFNFMDVSNRHLGKVKYQYMLEGIECVWSAPTYKTEASYGNLPPGKYKFRVKLFSNNPDNREAIFSFEILHPWWSATWFYFMVTIIIISAIYTYVKYRERKLKKDNARLEEQVALQTRELIEKNRELEKVIMEKDKLFTIIAHDLRSPFSSFLGIIQILSDDVTSFTTEQIKMFTDKMAKSAKNLFDLLENLLQWSRVQQGTLQFHPEKINLNQIAVESLGIILNNAEEKSIRLKIDIPKDIYITADSKMIETIVRNLMANAVKFTPRGGNVRLSASKQADGNVIITISDDGIGMSQELKSGLFELNTQNGRSGTEGEPSTGLGLIICKGLIEKHKGKLDVESEVKKGTTFTVTLPEEI